MPPKVKMFSNENRQLSVSKIFTSKDENNNIMSKSAEKKADSDTNCMQSHCFSKKSHCFLSM